MPPDTRRRLPSRSSSPWPTRRRSILAELAASGPATATTWPTRLPITRQAIAKHLTLLSEAGLVTAEPGERRRVRYRLRSAPMRVAQQFLAALARDWDGQLDALKDAHLDTKADRISTRSGGNAMKTPSIVTPAEWEAARERLLGEGEGSNQGQGRARGRTPPDALARNRKELRLRGAERQGQPARPVRGAQAADSLPGLLRARRARLAGSRLPGLLAGVRSGRPSHSPERP